MIIYDNLKKLVVSLFSTLLNLLPIWTAIYSDAMADDSADIKKRIKQLENQNLKLRKLLDTAIDVTNQDTTGISVLKDEAHDLAEAVENLEKQKAELESELTSVLGGNGMEDVVIRLETEHVDLKQKLTEVLNEIKKGDLEIKALRSEDEHLKAALGALEIEKNNLLKELKTLEEKKSSLSQMSMIVQEKLSEIENKKSSLTETKPPIEDGPSSEETILSNFKNLEKTYKDYLQALEDHDSLEQKISELEEKKDIGAVDSNSHRARSQLQLSRVIMSNTDVITKIRNVKSTLQSNLSSSNSSAKSLQVPRLEIMHLKVSELEKQKDELYQELEQSLENSSREIESLGEELSDPDIRRLINEIEIQKTVLLYNLKLLKINDNADESKLPSVPSVESNTLANGIPTTSEIEARVANLARSEEMFNTSIGSSSSYEPSTSSGHKNLEDEVARLENERTQLLRRLHSVSETSAQRFEERQLQTQSELHSTFMKERSSEQILTGQNYDDATNQLYGSEDARLEQRIRELEMENERIKKELDLVLEQISIEQNASNQVPVADVLRERIDELEMRLPILKTNLTTKKM